MKLIIGPAALCSKSLAPWLLLHHFKLPFQSTQYPLASRRPFPQWWEGEVHLWGALAICEYLNEAHLQRRAWPQSPQLRAKARAMVGDSLTQWRHLAQCAPFDCQYPEDGAMMGLAQEQLGHLDMLVGELYQGPWLCQHFSIADAMMAHWAIRLRHQSPHLSLICRRYFEQLHQHPAVDQWIVAAGRQTSL